ncbi:hypothetical protein FI667_g12755, partial [Globisporangium splendens]
MSLANNTGKNGGRHQHTQIDQIKYKHFQNYHLLADHAIIHVSAMCEGGVDHRQVIKSLQQLGGPRPNAKKTFVGGSKRFTHARPDTSIR